MQLFGKLTHKSASLYVQVFRYLVSGGTAFIVDFSTLWLLTEVVHLHYLLSSVIANVVGLVITYIFSIFWVFDTRSVDNRVAEFTIFAAIAGFGTLLTTLLMWFITECIGVQYLLSKVITTLCIAVLNFVLKKQLLFKVK